MDVGAVLSPLNLTHLLPLLDGQDLALERAALLVKLKELGVDKLPERQKIATAIAKALRGPAAPAPPPAKPRDDIVPQSFEVYCHNTTLADGTILNNHDQAPEFVIEALEARTGLKRPDNAESLSLHAMHLHFTTGGGKSYSNSVD